MTSPSCRSLRSDRRVLAAVPAVLRALLLALCAGTIAASGASAQVSKPQVPASTQPAPSQPQQPQPQPQQSQPQQPQPQQSQPQPLSPAASADAPLAVLGWLEGCWRGEVNGREFREFWMPPRGATLVGVGQLALHGRIEDYEYLRLESRPDGVYFVQLGGDRKEIAFKLAATTTDDKDTIFTFGNTTDAFPARLLYRRGVNGWLYETIEGPLDGKDQKVIYPLRRIGCESGELILK